MDHMASPRHESLARQMRVLFSVGVAGDLSDAELLERFASHEGDVAEGAFAILVERHGPMVLRVCRHVLRDGHAAEDAFQAAFLVLARRGRSLHASPSLAPWLQQVAWRTASKLRGNSARRRIHEARAAEAATEVRGGALWDDLAPALHEEIGRLPARYRVPLVLCYLEGLTALQVARQLGWPAGTVRSRLARGRQRLRARLIRRGLAPSAAALVAALSADSAWAEVPAALADMTTRAGVLFATCRVPAGAVPASILTLTEGVIQTMTLTKIKLIATVLAAGLATAAFAVAQAPGDGFGPGVQAKSADPQIVGKQPRGRGGRFADVAKRPANVYAPFDEGDPIVGPGPSDVTADAGRLEAVERKLDRILQALGALGPGEQAKTPPYFERTAPQEKVAPLDPATFDPTFLNVPGDFVDETAALKKGAPAGPRLRDARLMQARLGRVEQTLAELAERVQRLEDQAAKAPDAYRNRSGPEQKK
jgi:RNA polymerase sigma factor (sigma-70 family)